MTAITAAPAHREAKGYGLRQVARMEWIKLASQRYPKWIVAATVAEMAGVAVLASRTVAAHQGPGYDAVNNAMAGLALAQLVFGVLGVLMMTSEYSSGLIRNTLAAVPDRKLLLAVKAGVFSVVALVAGEICAFAAYLAAKLSIAHHLPVPALSDGAALRAVLLSGAYLALVGLIGIGLGTIIRHSAGAIGALVGVTFVLPLVLVPLPQHIEQGIGRFLPMVMAENSLTAVYRNPVFLSPWVSLGLLILYAAGLLATGGWLLTRRDA
jgi:ABC-2 type transport system permease protein